jgi:hypothetical protein
MSRDGPLAESAGPAGQAAQAGPASSRTASGVPPALDLAFDPGTLPVLRAEARAQARRAGLPEDRAADVVVAAGLRRGPDGAPEG